MTFFCCWLRSWASVDFPAMVKLPGCWEWSIILRTVRLIHRLSFGTRAPLSESLRGWGQTQKFNEWIPGGGQTQVRPVWWWVMLFWCNEWFPVWFLMTFFVLTHFSVSFLVGWIRAPTWEWQWISGNKKDDRVVGSDMTLKNNCLDERFGSKYPAHSSLFREVKSAPKSWDPWRWNGRGPWLSFVFP